MQEIHGEMKEKVANFGKEEDDENDDDDEGGDAMVVDEDEDGGGCPQPCPLFALLSWCLYPGADDLPQPDELADPTALKKPKTDE